MKNQNKNQKNLEAAIEAFKKEALAINGAEEELERVWIRVACDEDYRFTSEVFSSIQNWVKELHPVEAFKAEARALRMLGYEIGKVWTLFARDEYDHFSGAVEDALTNWVENWLYA